MAETDNVTRGLQILAARGAAGIATRGGLASQVDAIGGAGLTAGRKVFDSVTGQVVEVIGTTTAYLPEETIAEVSRG